MQGADRTHRQREERHWLPDGGDARMGNHLHGQHADLPEYGHRNGQTKPGRTGGRTAPSAGHLRSAGKLQRFLLCSGCGEVHPGDRGPRAGDAVCRGNGALPGRPCERYEPRKHTSERSAAGGTSGALGGAGGPETAGRKVAEMRPGDGGETSAERSAAADPGH